MDLHRFIQILFAVLIIAGLTIAPLVMPAAAGSAGAMTAHSAMSGDMPCCPEKQKQSDCQDCPLLAICMLKVLQSGRSRDGLPIRKALRQVLHPLDDPEIAGLTRPPPDQPPRTIV